MTHNLQPFKPITKNYQVKNRFQSLPFKCSLSPSLPLDPASAPVHANRAAVGAVQVESS
jgi:hypothetical protein